MAVVKRVGAGSALKVGLAVYGVLGLILGVFCSVMFLVGAPSALHEHIPFVGAFAGLFPLIVCPIMFGIMGGVSTVISALLYNLAANWVGGLEVEIH